MDKHVQWTDTQPKTYMNLFWQVGDALFTHDLFSEHASPMIIHTDQPTYQTRANAHNNNITCARQPYHDLGKI